MVFLHLPSTLTQEEEVLQMKYAKLRKKKKLLAAIKAQNSNKDTESKPVTGPITSTHKKPLGTGDAKEQAKKLIRSGTINLHPTQEKDRGGEKSTGFKRSQGLERKLTGLDNARAGYQPFSATHGPGGGFDTGGEDMNPEPEPPKKVTKNLYETFVAARDREERGIADAGESMSSLKSSDTKPRQGNTVYVFGYQITEDLLKNALSPLGKIVNISMEVEKVTIFKRFVQKFNFDFPRKLSISLCEKLAKMLWFWTF